MIDQLRQGKKMPTQFQDIAIGDEFETTVEAEGPTLLYYKVTPNAAFQTQGPGSGKRRSFKPSDELEVNGRRQTLHNTPTDLERAAVTLISEGASHTGLALWTKSIAVDPEEIRSLDEFIAVYFFEADEGSVKLSEFLKKEGFVTPETQGAGEPSAASAILDLKPRGRHPESPTDWRAASLDAAIWRLANAIIAYRLAGRPDSPAAQSLWERGSGLLKSTNPLTVALVDFHLAVLKNTD
jgi:hypothetical protein